MDKQTIVRRSFLAQVAGVAALGASAGAARAQLTDSDTSDPAGGGRQRYTDGDTGSSADPAGRGRGPRIEEQTGRTDSDSGSQADGAGRGRGRPGEQTGVTDGDSGATADVSGQGRGGQPIRRTGYTDSDSGDRSGYGRRITPPGQTPKR